MLEFGKLHRPLQAMFPRAFKEAGTNEYWLVGGKLPDGNSELVIDIGGVPSSMYNSKNVKD